MLYLNFNSISADSYTVIFKYIISFSGVKKCKHNQYFYQGRPVLIYIQTTVHQWYYNPINSGIMSYGTSTKYEFCHKCETGI